MRTTNATVFQKQGIIFKNKEILLQLCHEQLLQYGKSSILYNRCNEYTKTGVKSYNQRKLLCSVN